MQVLFSLSHQTVLLVKLVKNFIHLWHRRYSAASCDPEWTPIIPRGTWRHKPRSEGGGGGGGGGGGASGSHFHSSATSGPLTNILRVRSLRASAALRTQHARGGPWLRPVRMTWRSGVELWDVQTCASLLSQHPSQQQGKEKQKEGEAKQGKSFFLWLGRRRASRHGWARAVRVSRTRRTDENFLHTVEEWLHSCHFVFVILCERTRNIQKKKCFNLWGSMEQKSEAMARESEDPAMTKDSKVKRQRKKKLKESKTRTVHANILYDHAKGEENPNRHYANNEIKTTKYTLLSFLPKNLFEQFHRFANVYFVFIALLNFVPVVNAFQPELALAPVVFILSVTAIKDLWEDYRRHRSDQEINHMDCLVYSR